MIANFTQKCFQSEVQIRLNAEGSGQEAMQCSSAVFSARFWKI